MLGQRVTQKLTTQDAKRPPTSLRTLRANPAQREVEASNEARAKTSSSFTQRWIGRKRGREGGGGKGGGGNPLSTGAVVCRRGSQQGRGVER